MEDSKSGRSPNLRNFWRTRICACGKSRNLNWWNAGAKYYFSRANTLFVTVGDHVVIRIDLAGGSYRVGVPGTFRDYAAVASDVNALTEIWKTSLRFSSITDILAARGASPDRRF